MGRFAQGLVALVSAAAASVGCGLFTGAGDLAADLPDDDGGVAQGDATAPPPAQIKCGSGTKLCGDECVGDSDPAFGCAGSACDRCAVSFAASLKCNGQGRCAPSTCFDGRADCNMDPTDGCEADLSLPQTCGSCGQTCKAGEYCAGAQGCVTSCPTGTSLCGLSCIDLTSSASHCGTCTRVCPSAANAVATCKASACTITCNPGYGDCDMNPSNGCEPLTPYFTDADGDGHGAKGSMSAGQACTVPAGFSAVADDCLDTNPQVFFGQTLYFPAPYSTATGMSFDYNCSGAEEIEPMTPLTSCPAVCLPGYDKVAGTTSYCGSTKYERCLQGCGVDLATKPAVSCH